MYQYQETFSEQRSTQAFSHKISCTAFSRTAPNWPDAIYPQIPSDPCTTIWTHPQTWHTKPLKRNKQKKKSRPLNLAHQWILISIDTHLTCKSTGSLTQTFCVVTWWDVASYLDTRVFPALPLLCRQSSAPTKKRHNPQSTQTEVPVRRAAALVWLRRSAAWHLPKEPHHANLRSQIVDGLFPTRSGTAGLMKDPFLPRQTLILQVQASG